MEYSEKDGPHITTQTLPVFYEQGAKDQLFCYSLYDLISIEYSGDLDY